VEAEIRHPETAAIPEGVVVPEGARIPEGATFFDGPDDGKCRVVKSSGERCGAPRMSRFGLCAGHAGRGLSSDPGAASERSREIRAKLKARRQLLGVPPLGRASPRQLARVQALERAEEVAAALIGPLDDPTLSATGRQLGALRLLDAVLPLTTVETELELLADPETMGWEQMKALAARLLGPEAVEGENLAIARQAEGVDYRPSSRSA
jgi:hypothetical protein